MSDAITKDELQSALREQTDEIVTVLQAFMQQVDATRESVAYSKP